MSDKKGGSNREWGYPSYDVDNPDDEKLIYTSYERSGSVNKYNDNGDGGHGHQYWKSADDYNNSEEPDQSRLESNKYSNPSVEDVQKDGGCYLTTACMKHLKETFDDNCYELTMLRWFRDKFLSKEDIEHYYITAPIVIKALDNIPDNEDIYEHIYQNVILKCIDDIKAMNYESAYARYKNMVLTLEEQFARSVLEQRLVNVIKPKTLIYQ